MTKKKETQVDLKTLEPDEKMRYEVKILEQDELIKYEVAEELGLLDRVLSEGWKSLTSKETGRIGGMVTKRKKQMKQGDDPAI